MYTRTYGTTILRLKSISGADARGFALSVNIHLALHVPLFSLALLAIIQVAIVRSVRARWVIRGVYILKLGVASGFVLVKLGRKTVFQMEVTRYRVHGMYDGLLASFDQGETRYYYLERGRRSHPFMASMYNRTAFHFREYT